MRIRAHGVVLMQVPPNRSLLSGSAWPLWLVAAAVIALATALLSIWLGRHHSLKAKAIWTVISIALPILGPLGWFVLGRERRRK